METSYVVYILTCADGTLYTGVTTDIVRRLKEHNESDKGAKYTKTRRPVLLGYTEVCASRSAAQKREYIVRNLSRAEKISLISSERNVKPL
ncbi:MAG: GIY-YIG nuclease family protein [Patescibacteria group bacterium]